MINFNSILYMFSNMDSSSQVLLFLIILVSLMLVSILVINYITKKKNDKILKGVSLKKKISTISQKIDTANKDIKPLVNLKKENKEIPIKEVKKQEVEEVVKVVPKKTSIDDIAKLIEDTLEKEPINLTEFEEDQEENAIISYDELVKRAGSQKIVYKCEEVEVLNELEPEKEEQIEQIEKIEEEPKKFKASKVISPIFGIQKEKEEKDEVLESFIDLEEFKFDKKNDEIEETKNLEFLTSLKEFRSNLE